MSRALPIPTHQTLTSVKHDAASVAPTEKDPAVHVAPFDAVIRFLIARSKRRTLLRGLIVAALGIPTSIFPESTGARKRRHHRKNRTNPPQLNAFGCLDVGQTCRGLDELCCSGICEGTKPKKGERDKSQCIAHNTGGCSPLQDLCTTDPNTLCGATGVCARTTGNAGFCLDSTVGQLNCVACKKDADCTAGFGPGAACLVCDVACPATRTVCAPPAA